MAGYVGNVPVPQSVREDQSFTATAGQTTFNTLGYTDGNRIKVTLNGVLLEGGGVDYTATNGSDVVLTVAAVVDDIVRFETFNEVQLVSNTSTTPIIKTNLTLKNDTHEDTDGGRESTVIFSGEQSGGEITTLAEIEASHDGTADDQKGDLIFRTNDGNDGTSPTERLRINSGGDMLFSSEDPSLTLANTTHEDSDGGRESTIAFQGEQSGGEVSLLAQIEAAHDGTADDQKGDLIFRTNDGADGTSPTEAMRIDSAQNVGIGTSSTDISGNGTSYVGLSVVETVGSRRGFIEIGDNQNADTGGIGDINFVGHYQNAGHKVMASVRGVADGSTSGQRGANVKILTKADASSTLSERVRIDSDGLKFNGDTAAANALSDYETGTAAMTVTGSGNNAAITTSGTPDYFYVKIGDMVQFQGELYVTSVSGATGAIQINLPITSHDYAAGSLRCYNAVFGGTSPFCEAHPSGTKLYFSSNSSNAATQSILSNGYYFFSISYRAS